MDIKPSSKNYATVFKLINIWGYSSYGWTPLLLELNELLVDEDIKTVNKHDFLLNNYGVIPVYTFLYLQGSIQNGQLTGSWNWPPRSSTNSALLWPEALAYFYKQLRI